MSASWLQVKHLVQAALERTPDARAAYLSQACRGDDELRLEVESLLSAHERAGSFLDRRASLPLGLQPHSEGGDPAEWRLAIGEGLGPFCILSRLGAGGMGEVYRARDTRLNRTVAIKVLLARLADQPELRTLLEREAIAISALNHPNICALYDVGHQDGVDFLVMEYLDGEALDERLARGPLPAEQVLRVAIEIADGLAQAHANGVIHRDLKPSNVMLTKSGAKLLDFGLAQLRNPSAAPVGTASGYTALTREGALLGTLQYMAPEQLEGKPTDARTDLFALGAVLYEMLTGRPPFAGTSHASVTAAILARDPAPFDTIQPQPLPSLVAVVMRCLAKDPDHRWPSCRELIAELKRISGTNPASGERTAEGRQWPGVPFQWGGRRQRIVAAVTIAAALGALVFGVASRKPTTGATPASEWIPLTSFADSATSPALSRDGRMLVFVRGADTFTSSGQIYVKLLPNGEPVEVTHDDTLKMSPVFSPDGSRIAYTVPVSWDTWILPVLGGPSRLWLPNASGLTWIDDHGILFAEIKRGRHMALVTGTDNRGDVRDVYVPASETGMAHRASLSPDRTSVLVSEMNGAGWLPCRLVRFDGSSREFQVGPAGAACTNAAWSPDGRWMYFSANAGGTFHIWRQRVPDGTPEQVTAGPTEEEGLAMAPDGRSLVTSVGMTQSTVWIRKNGIERKVASQTHAWLPSPEGRSGRSVLSPDAQTLYYLGQRGSVPLHASGELWTTTIESGASTRLLTEFAVTSFDLSPDGTQIVFAALDGDGFGMWVVSVDRRSPPLRISASTADRNPVFRGASEILFQSDEAQSTFLYRVGVDGSGRRKFVMPRIIEFETVSPDGEWVIVQVPAGGNDGPRATMAYPAGEGAPIRICAGLCTARWSLDAKVLYIGWGRTNESSDAWRTFGIPLGPNQIFPELPTSGISSESELAAFKGVTATEGAVYPGPDSSLHAFTRRSAHRNLYRIPLH